MIQRNQKKKERKNVSGAGRYCHTVGRLNAVTHEGEKIRPGLAPETLQ
jgi:hypothetical protein